MDKETVADKALNMEGGSKDVNYDKTRYLPGMYRSDRYFRIIKELTYEHVRDANGTIQRTTGTWSKPSNVIIFQKGVETRLTESDLALPAVRSLIDRKFIYRVG